MANGFQSQQAPPHPGFNSSTTAVTNPPPGFQLDEADATPAPSPPAGFQLDTEQQSIAKPDPPPGFKLDELEREPVEVAGKPAFPGAKPGLADPELLEPPQEGFELGEAEVLPVDVLPPTEYQPPPSKFVESQEKLRSYRESLGITDDTTKEIEVVSVVTGKPEKVKIPTPEEFDAVEVLEGGGLEVPAYDPIDIAVDAATAGLAAPARAGVKQILKRVAAETATGAGVGAGMVAADIAGGGVVAELAAGLGGGVAASAALTSARQGIIRVLQKEGVQGAESKAVKIIDDVANEIIPARARSIDIVDEPAMAIKPPEGFEVDKQVAHQMPDGTTMRGPEHPGAVPGTTREVEAATGVEALAFPIQREIEPIPESALVEPIKEGVRRSTIIKDLEKAFEVPVKTGKFKQKALGIYKIRPQVVRLGSPNDIETAVHEVAHHFQDLLGFPRKMPSEVQALAYEGPGVNKDREGFAEFVRAYVTQPRVAQDRAPAFYQQFEQQLSRHPDAQQALVKARQSWNAWEQAPSVEKVKSFIVSGEGKKKGLNITANEVYTNLIDELNPLRVLKERAEKQLDRSLRPNEDPFLLAWLNRGWAKKADEWLRGSRFRSEPDQGYQVLGKPLKDILEPIEKKGLRQDLDAYLVAMRAATDQRVSQGFKGLLSEGDFKQTISDILARNPEIKQVGREIQEYSSDLLDNLVTSGRISQDAANAIKKRNLFYAPLYRVVDSESPIKGLSRKKLGNLFNPIKQLKGSSRDIWSPTESLLKNTYSFINAAERQKVGNALLRISDMEGFGDVIERIPFKLKPVIANKDDYIRSIAKNSGIDTKTKEGKQVIESMGLHGLPDNVLISFQPNMKPGPNEVVFYRNGKPELYELDPDLYSALQSTNTEALGFLEKILSYPTKWLRAGATLSPEFIARNPIRDQLTAFIYSKYGYIPGWDLLRGILDITTGAEVYRKFNASGAAQAGLVSLDREYLNKSLDELMKGRKITNLVKNPLKMLQILSELSEEGTRVSEFRRALAVEGETAEGLAKAAQAARDVTLDFSRIGLKTRGINLITAFWNAQVQGVDKMVREFRKNPGRTFTKSFLGVTVPSLALYAAQHDDPVYQEIPEWRRVMFWNIVTYPDGEKADGDKEAIAKLFSGVGGGRFKGVVNGRRVHIWSIPKPFELGILFGSVPEMALEWMKNNDPEGFKAAMRSLGESILPSFIPTATVPIVEWFANKSTFFNRPIVPRSKEGLAPELQFSKRTSEAVKLIAEQMARVPGLKKIAVPAKIENMIRAYSGGTGRLALEGIDRVLKEFGVVKTKIEPIKTVEDLPLIRGFTQRFPTANSRSIEAFYREYDEAKTKWESQKQRAGIRGTGIKIGKPPELERLERAGRILSTLRKSSDNIYDSDKYTAEEKKESIDRVYLTMINLARAVRGLPQIPIKQTGGP